MANALDDALHKLERGKEHLANLYDLILGRLQKQKVSHEIKLNSYTKPPDTRTFSVYTVIFSALPVIGWEGGILLGETVQCFRSSLDYFAWAMVSKMCRGRFTVKEMKSVEFPVARTRKGFRDGVDKSLPHTTNEQRAFFERYQPYRRSDDCRFMRYLRILSNTDKHRVIIPIYTYPETIDVDFRWITHPEIEHIDMIERLKHGRKIKEILAQAANYF